MTVKNIQTRNIVEMSKAKSKKPRSKGANSNTATVQRRPLFTKEVVRQKRIPKSMDELCCKHAAQYCEVVDNPSRGPGRIPLPENGLIPCKSETLTVTSRNTVSIASLQTQLTIWAIPEGVPELKEQEEHYTSCVVTTSLGDIQAPLAPSGAASAMLFVQQDPSGDPVTGLPSGAPGLVPLFNDNYDQRMAFVNGFAVSAQAAADVFRLVGFEVKYSILGRQVNIEGNVETVCLYETPGPQNPFSAYRVSDSYRTRTFGRSRSVTHKFYPNCETIQYRPIGNPLSGNRMPVRMMALITDLQAGDKVLIESVAQYEVVRPKALGLAAPSPVTKDVSHLTNAIMTHAGQPGKLLDHVVAHKIISHPWLSHVRTLGKHALEVIGGANIGSKLMTAVKSALVEGAEFVERAAPLL